MLVQVLIAPPEFGRNPMEISRESQGQVASHWWLMLSPRRFRNEGRKPSELRSFIKAPTLVEVVVIKILESPILERVLPYTSVMANIWCPDKIFQWLRTCNSLSENFERRPIPQKRQDGVQMVRAFSHSRGWYYSSSATSSIGFIKAPSPLAHDTSLQHDEHVIALAIFLHSRRVVDTDVPRFHRYVFVLHNTPHCQSEAYDEIVQ